MVFGTYSDFEECDFCTDRYTTKCWFNCKIYNIKNSILKLNNYIATKLDLDDDIIMINTKYDMYLKKYSKLGIVSNTILYETNLLDDDIISVILSKKALKDYNDLNCNMIVNL